MYLLDINFHEMSVVIHVFTRYKLSGDGGLETCTIINIYKYV